MTVDFRPPVPQLTGRFQFIGACPACHADCVWFATADGETPICNCDQETAS